MVTPCSLFGGALDIAAIEGKTDCRDQFGITMVPVAPSFRLAAVVGS
jgi:hypothetical protein